MPDTRKASREKIRKILLLAGADWSGVGFEDLIDMVAYSLRYQEILPDHQYAYLAQMVGVMPVTMKIRIRNQVKRIHRYQLLRGSATSVRPPSTAEFLTAICAQFDKGAVEWTQQKSR